MSSQPVTVLATNQHRQSVVFRGQLSAVQVMAVADAFLVHGADSEIRRSLRETFGKWNFRSYCLDFSGTCFCRITFSVYRDADVAVVRGEPIAIAPNHTSDFEVYVQVCDLQSFPLHPQKAAATAIST